METTHVVFALGGVPLFASRLFITAFVAALAARWYPEIFVEFPSWATEDPVLWGLAVLAILENRMTKSPEITELMSFVDPWVKPAGQFFFSHFVLTTGTVAVVSVAVVHAGLGGAGVAAIVGLVTAAGVWFVAMIRNSVLASLTELDSEDDLGLRRLLSWAEDGWAAVGMVLLVLLPVLALIVSGGVVLGLVIVQRYLQAREEKLKVPCEHCPELILPSAIRCFSCRRPVRQPRQVGAFGQSLSAIVTDVEGHRLRLISRRRCPVCATRLPKKSVRQTCNACGTECFESRQRAEEYLAFLSGKLQRTLLVCGAFSLVPVLGLIPGIIYYRLSLLSGIRTYIPHSVGCLTRWGVRLLNILLLALQSLPLLGAVMLPLMCWINYAVYRKVLEREMSIRLESPVAAAIPVQGLS